MSAALLCGMQANATQQMRLFGRIGQRWGVFGYTLETGWLDITSDFEVALFFATCYWDRGQWKPLKREQTEVDEKHQYGMIFHMPSNRMPGRWIRAIHSFMPWTEKPVGKNCDGNDVYGRLAHPIYKGEMENLIYPLGFQPFMRCHMQNGYGIYMRTPKNT